MITKIQQKISSGINQLFYQNYNQRKLQQPISEYSGNNGSEQVSKNRAAIIKSNIRLENEYYKNFLYKDGKVTLEEFFDISNNHPSIFTKAQNSLDKAFLFSTTPYDMAIIAAKIDEYLRNNYENCRIVSVGTSPAPLCEALSLMGHDVIFLPFSNFSNYEEKEYSPDEMPNLDIAMEYLKHKGFKKDDKTNIIIDFTSSGATLNKLYSVIEERFPDIPKERLIKMPIKSLMDISLTGFNIFQRNKLYLYLEDMADSFTEEISNVPHFYIIPCEQQTDKSSEYSVSSKNKTKEDIFKEFDDFSRPLARAFALCTYNRIYKMQNQKNNL